MCKPDPEVVALVILDAASLFGITGFIAMVAMFAALLCERVPT